MIITQTPLRISFAGGGTDLASYYAAREGFVVSAAIDKFAYVIVKERFDDLIYLNTMKKEIREDVSQVEHELIREAMRMTGVTKEPAVSENTREPASFPDRSSSIALSTSDISRPSASAEAVRNESAISSRAAFLRQSIRFCSCACFRPTGHISSFVASRSSAMSRSPRSADSNRFAAAAIAFASSAGDDARKIRRIAWSSDPTTTSTSPGVAKFS